MRRIALVGGAQSRMAAHSLPDEVEIWTLNRMGLPDDDGKHEFPKIDRLVEIHPDWFVLSDWYDYGPEYTAWLIQPHPFPIYMQEILPDVPSSVNYPLEKILSYLFEHLWIGEQRADYMTSSFSYLLGLAIFELRKTRGYRSIECYGFEMRNESEYAYQKPGALLLMGLGAGKGIDMITPEASDLLRANLYAYEVFDMIPRQMLEEYRMQYRKDLEKWKAMTNRHEAEGIVYTQEYTDLKNAPGIMLNRKKKMAAKDAQVKVAFKLWQDAFGAMRAADAAVQVMDKLIAKCDLQDTPIELMETVGRILETPRLKETVLD